MTLMLTGLSVAACVAAQAVVVYKHVDSSGRVTYSNQAIKGGVIVELSPLMVLPKSQTTVAARGDSLAAEANASPRTTPETSLAPRLMQSPDQLSSRKSVTSDKGADALQKEAIRPDSIGTARTNVAEMAKQRRADVRRRILEGEIDAESQLLLEAQADLQREQTKSGAMRSLRSALSAEERHAAGKNSDSEDAANAKRVVERHFERIRELQDRASMHEENLAELRSQLRVPATNLGLRTVKLQPIAANGATLSGASTR